jgi:hypothetical protein
MAVPIGSPASSHPWHPHIAVIRIRTPGAIVIKVFIANDIARNVSRRPRCILAAVAVLAPIVKLIRALGSVDVGIK